MSNLFKNKGMPATMLSCVFFVIIVTAASAAAFLGPKTPADASSDNSSQTSEEATPVDGSSSSVTNQEGVIITTPVAYNKPSKMSAVYITPGVDFLATSDTSAAKVKTEIEKAIGTAKSFKMNTVIINTTMKDKVIYKTDSLPSAVSADFDPLEYAVTYARSQNMYVYTIFDALLYSQDGKLTDPQVINNDVINAAVKNAVDLASKYKPDGVLLDSYYNKTTATSYSSYLKSGGSVGFENYMKAVPDTLIYNTSEQVHKMAPGVQLGLLTDEVWENKSANEAGSDTNASFCALSDGNADTKRYLEDKLFDFVAVKSYGSLTDRAVPFAKVVKWWADLSKKNNLQMFVVQASDRICTDNAGWSEKEQIIKQIIEAEKISGYCGSIFNNLKRLIENPSGVRELLIKYLNKEIKSDFILTQLTFTKPAQTEFSTYEPTVNFTGACDPNEPLYMGDKEVETDKNGFFSVMADLKPGKNTFTFKHKDKTATYNITRSVKVLKEVTPSGNVTVNGGMKITISALAYEGSTVTANVNGSNVTLHQSNTEDDNTNKESTYKLFVGEYTAPQASSSAQSLGNIKITATWGGVTETMTGAAIKVNEKIDFTDGSPVEISARSAETFPTSELNDLSDPNYYPLGKGARDYTVGDEIIYKEGSSTFSYYRLASDRRVYSSDIRSISAGPKDSKIKGMTVDADSNYTKVILKTDQNPSYTFKYSSSQITIQFHNTKSIPGNISSLTKNPLFDSATWSGTTLKLSMRNDGAFLGYIAYYEGNDLVFRFNNPPSGGGVSGARIIVDAGHGGSDPGALGYNPSYPESYINAQIASELTSKLNSMGADVNMIGNDSTRLDSRMAAAQSYNASMYVAIHCNSASPSATGSEAYYFYSSSSSLASSASYGCSQALGNNNRGGKFGRFRVTRDSQFAATLVECGFVTNSGEFAKLFDSSYQNEIADNLASSIRSYYNNAGAGTSLTGVQSVGEAAGVPVTGVTLNQTSLSIAVGDTAKLTATVTPDTATNKDVTWSSDNTNIATVAADGTITAKAAGTAKITVKTADGDKTAVCTVTVTNKGVAGVTLNKTSTSIEVGKTEKLTATIIPDNAPNKNVSWSSDNTNIATVASDGTITAKAPGTAKITVTTADGGKTAYCTVTVTTATIPVSGVTLNKTSTSIEVGKTEKLVATIIPDGASNKNVTWHSNNQGIATVSSDGTVAGVAAGTATITVTTADGSKTATCTVAVTAAPSVPPASSSSSTSVESIALSQPALSLAAGANTKLTFTISPDGASNKAVSWSSSNQDVATVDSEGNVSAKPTAIAGQSATITVTTADGGKTATCIITIS